MKGGLVNDLRENLFICCSISTAFVSACGRSAASCMAHNCLCRLGVSLPLQDLSACVCLLAVYLLQSIHCKFVLFSHRKYNNVK